MNDIPYIVVGAGPAGLATAYQLQRRNMPYQVVERHAIGYAWRNHYDKLHLHTLKHVSALPGLPMPSHYPNFLSAAQHVAYLEQYAQRFRLNIQCGIDVQQAIWNGTTWILLTSEGAMQCRRLIATTGIWSTPYQPTFAGQDQFAGRIIHARDYRNPQPFLGQRVLVIGVGNSGSEIAVDLTEQGVKTAIAIRDGATFVAHPSSALAMRLLALAMRNVPRPMGEAFLRKVRHDFRAIGIRPPVKPLVDTYAVVGYRFPQLVQSGNIKVYGGIRQLQRYGVQFEDGQEDHFDTIIMATGYRASLQWVASEVDFDQQGRPITDAHWRSLRNPMLSCVGYWYPATEGWLQSIGRVTKQAVQGLQM